MNPKVPPELTVETLLALRQESDALRLITEKLRVKEMGPADHIRTKHEAKSFIETGDINDAAALVNAAKDRVSEQLGSRQGFTQRQAPGQKM